MVFSSPVEMWAMSLLSEPGSWRSGFQGAPTPESQTAGTLCPCHSHHLCQHHVPPMALGDSRSKGVTSQSHRAGFGAEICYGLGVCLSFLTVSLKLLLVRQLKELWVGLSTLSTGDSVSVKVIWDCLGSEQPGLVKSFLPVVVRMN